MRLYLMTLLVFSALISNAQLKKGQFLLGGAGNFSWQKSDQDEPFFKQDYKETQLTLEPKLGYFVIDRLAVGLKIGYSHVKQDQYLFAITPLYETETYSISKVNQFAIGPFLRYYFLPEQKRLNLFAEAGWTYGKEKANTNSKQATGPVLGTGGSPVYSESKTEVKNSVNTFSINAGPVIFVSPNVSFELSLGYAYAKVKGQARNGIAIGTGFLVYLPK